MKSRRTKSPVYYTQSFPIIRVYVTRQAMYVLRNVEARSRNHCCCGKAISITYSECVSVALVIQHSKHMRRIIL
jgi:hypothetical protein